MLTKMISELLAGSPTRIAEIPANIDGVTCKLTVEQVLRLATPADSASAPAAHALLEHVVAGLTAGHVLVATSPTTFEFRRLSEAHLPAIPHGNLADAGANTHAQLDAHLASTANPHATTAEQAGAVSLEDRGKVLTSGLDAGPRYLVEAVQVAGALQMDLNPGSQHVALRLTVPFGSGASDVSRGNHLHLGIYEPANANIQSHIADATKHRTINDSGTAATDLWSAARILAEVAALGAAVVAALADKAGLGHNHDLASLSERAYVSLTGRPSFFAVVAVSGQSSVVADAEGDTLTLAAGAGIAITTDQATDRVTITNTGGGMPGPHGHAGPADGGAFTSLAVGGNVVWHAGNDGSGSGLDADTLDGMQPTGAATGNTVVARDANGDFSGRYINATYFNMSHAAATRTGDTVFFSSTDAYIRKNTKEGYLASLGLANAWTADNDGPNTGLDADTVDGKHAEELGSPALRVLMAREFGGF